MINKAELEGLYRDYIACLNRRDWARLGRCATASQMDTVADELLTARTLATAVKAIT